MRIAWLDWCTKTGRGYLSLDAVRWLGARWIAPRHPRWGYNLGDEARDLDVVRVGNRSNPEPDVVASSLNDVDVLVVVENPACPGVLNEAKRRGMPVVLLAMSEWLTPGRGWVACVDAVLCPTLECLRFAREVWVSQYKNVWRAVEYVPWPIDADRFPFRWRARDLEEAFHGAGTLGVAGRKGTAAVLEAAKLTPSLRWRIATQMPDALDDVPANVVVDGRHERRDTVYRTGWCAVQPSRIEGLGLQLLEAMASGMLLITTAGPPMSELPALLAPARPAEARHGRRVTVWDVDVPTLARTVEEAKSWPESRYQEAVWCGTEYVRTWRNWRIMRDHVRALIGDVVGLSG